MKGWKNKEGKKDWNKDREINNGRKVTERRRKRKRDTEEKKGGEKRKKDTELNEKENK